MQDLQDLRVSFLAVFDVGHDIRRAVFDDRSMARVEFVVFGFPFDERETKVVHFLQTTHVVA